MFASSLGSIDFMLTSLYQIPPDDAAEIERALYEWFPRFACRPGNLKSGESLRAYLLVMACGAGHDYWSWRVAGGRATDERIGRALSLDPRELAIELQKEIERDQTG